MIQISTRSFTFANLRLEFEAEKLIRGNQRAENWFVDFRLIQFVVDVIDYEG